MRGPQVPFSKSRHFAAPSKVSVAMNHVFKKARVPPLDAKELIRNRRLAC